MALPGNWPRSLLCTSVLLTLASSPASAEQRSWSLTLTGSLLFDDNALLSSNADENSTASDSEELLNNSTLPRRYDQADRLSLSGDWLVHSTEQSRYWLDTLLQSTRYQESPAAQRDIYGFGLNSYHLHGPWQIAASASFNWNTDELRLYQYDQSLSLTTALQSGEFSRESLVWSAQRTYYTATVSDTSYDPDGTYQLLSLSHRHYLPHLLIEGQYSVVDAALVVSRNNANGYYYDSRGRGVSLSLSQPLDGRNQLQLSYNMRYNSYDNIDAAGGMLRNDTYEALVMSYSHSMDAPGWHFSISCTLTRNDSNVDGDSDYSRGFTLFSVSRTL